MRMLVDNQNLTANLFACLEARGHILDAAPEGLTGLQLAMVQSRGMVSAGLDAAPREASN